MLRCKKSFFVILLFSSFNVFSQSISMPTMPTTSSISSPAMPSLSTPTLGGKFYTPGAKLKKAEPIQQGVTQNTEVTTNTTKQTNKTNDILSRISAQDLSSLEDTGMFNSIYGLLNNKSTNQLQIHDEQILSQILTELNELKEITKNQTNQNVSYKNINQQNSPKILRFYINGQNILNTCRTIFFSKKEKDGTFLLTGDRKFSIQNKPRDETFYFLFKPNQTNGTTTEYDVIPNLIQDSTNEESILFNFTNEEPLAATKTGNLISVKTKASNFNVDLLLDIGE